MAITKDANRQYPLVAKVEFTYSDLGTAVTASTILEAIDLPANAIVIGGYLCVTTAWVGPTVATVDIGDGSDTDRYSSTPVNLLAIGKTALNFATTANPHEYTAPDTIDLDLVQTVAVSTAGAGYLQVEYVIDGRGQENQG